MEGDGRPGTATEARRQQLQLQRDEALARAEEALIAASKDHDFKKQLVEKAGRELEAARRDDDRCKAEYKTAKADFKQAQNNTTLKAAFKVAKKASLDAADLVPSREAALAEAEKALEAAARILRDAKRTRKICSGASARPPKDWRERMSKYGLGPRRQQ